MERYDFQILILKHPIFDARPCIVDIFLGDLIGQVFFEMMEPSGEVLLIQQLLDKVLGSHAPPAPPTPVDIGIGQDLKAHLIANFLKIIVEPRSKEQLGIPRILIGIQSQHEADQSAHRIGVYFGEKHVACPRESHVVLADEPLERLWHVDYVLLVLDCYEDGWQLLHEVTLDELIAHVHCIYNSGECGQTHGCAGIGKEHGVGHQPGLGQQKVQISQGLAKV